MSWEVRAFAARKRADGSWLSILWNGGRVLIDRQTHQPIVPERPGLMNRKEGKLTETYVVRFFRSSWCGPTAKEIPATDPSIDLLSTSTNTGTQSSQLSTYEPR